MRSCMAFKVETSLLRIDIDWSVTTEGIEVQFRDNGQGIQEEHSHMLSRSSLRMGWPVARFGPLQCLQHGDECVRRNDTVLRTRMARTVVKFRQATGS